ncbi:Sodium/hydrogen exchanger domain-containing protein 1 [Paragonimus heterotremus]|uniref:Sodium/hydrogen exchanger domain-containing protein 1 n=1 Tax=Paragonimus heterotremus TaxID=100268 RepID=A0A8J4SSV9_9TREM|nr:Sodium/hydrogen exchanger domain-containing protein 1 [Paragonimus heterotremus]
MMIRTDKPDTFVPVDIDGASDVDGRTPMNKVLFARNTKPAHKNETFTNLELIQNHFRARSVSESAAVNKSEFPDHLIASDVTYCYRVTQPVTATAQPSNVNPSILNKPNKQSRSANITLTTNAIPQTRLSSVQAAVGNAQPVRGNAGPVQVDPQHVKPLSNRMSGLGRPETAALSAGKQICPPSDHTVHQYSRPVRAARGAAAVCRAHCSRCMRFFRPPPWMIRIFLFLYTNLGGAFTYVFLLLAIYTTCYSIRPSVAQFPICRRFAMPTGLNSTNTSNTLKDGYKQSSVYVIGLECRRGEALSVLIFYGFGFLFGELMELMHLPGLLGMLLGGLALRNIGLVLIPENVYHEGYRPNGSYLMTSDLSKLNDTEYLESFGSSSDIQFDVRDPLTQLAALLLVNPSLSGILRQLALTTILSRAGLGLDPATLKQVCGSVFRLALIPCFCEAFTLMLVTRFLIGWPWSWGAILGFVCAAVSPAVIVPNMMRLEVTGWGVAEGIPTLVVAASSLDDVVAITGFGVALAVALSKGQSLSEALIQGPKEAILGAMYGAGVGVLICLLPPPKLEHSHLLRGILLICMAVTGLVGSMVLHLSGGGALACLTLAFFVATGWRAGFPWRLTQPEKDPMVATFVDVDDKEIEDKSNLSSPPASTSGAFPSSIPHDAPGGLGKVYGLNASNPAVKSPAFESDTGVKSGTVVEEKEELELTEDEKVHSSAKKRSPNILETLVEYHPYYCSILRQQYVSPNLKSSSQRSSKRSLVSKKGFKIIAGGDLPAIAVAVAATGTERRVSTNLSTPHISIRSRPRASRRFSLPEPTAHYELESFSVPSSARKALSPSSDGSSIRNAFPIRRRLLTPTFREQYASMHHQTVEKLAEIEENDYDQNELTRSKSDAAVILDDQQNSNVLEADVAPGAGGAVGSLSLVCRLPATPKERGLACVKSMRQTLAALWWFVQPILFSLIGSEVNLTQIAGQSIGQGIASLLIALTVRMGATIVAVLPSKLNMKERLFVGFSWLPKATVQAAVGPIALDTARRQNAGPEIIGYGEQVLTLAALAILITAPLGAILMPLTAPYLLRQDLSASEVMVSRTRRSTAGIIQSDQPPAHSTPVGPASAADIKPANTCTGISH